MIPIIYFNGDYFALKKKNLDILVDAFSSMDKLYRIWEDNEEGRQYYWADSISKSNIRIEIVNDNAICTEGEWKHLEARMKEQKELKKAEEEAKKAKEEENA